MAEIEKKRRKTQHTHTSLFVLLNNKNTKQTAITYFESYLLFSIEFDTS